VIGDQWSVGNARASSLGLGALLRRFGNRFDFLTLQKSAGAPAQSKTLARIASPSTAH
jgi:hypothetical protein